MYHTSIRDLSRNISTYPYVTSVRSAERARCLLIAVSLMMPYMHIQYTIDLRLLGEISRYFVVYLLPQGIARMESELREWSSRMAYDNGVREWRTRMECEIDYRNVRTSNLNLKSEAAAATTGAFLKCTTIVHHLPLRTPQARMHSRPRGNPASRGVSQYLPLASELSLEKGDNRPCSFRLTRPAFLLFLHCMHLIYDDLYNLYNVDHII